MRRTFFRPIMRNRLFPVITFTGNSDLKVKLKTVQKIKGQGIKTDKFLRDING